MLFEPQPQIVARSVDHRELSISFFDALRQGRKKTKIHVHGLESAGARKVTARDMAQQGAESSGRRRQLRLPSELLRGGEPTREKADGRALDVSLDAGDLTGKPNVGAISQTQLAIE